MRPRFTVCFEAPGLDEEMSSALSFRASHEQNRRQQSFEPDQTVTRLPVGIGSIQSRTITTSPGARVTQSKPWPGSMGCDHPVRRTQFRLLDVGSAAMNKRARVITLDAAHRRRPLGPTFDVGYHVPDRRRCGGDVACNN